MTTETKWPSGPWKLDVIPEDWDGEDGPPEERFEIRMGEAIASRRWHPSNHLIEIDWSLAPGTEQYEEAVATLNLIVAAPDVYATATRVLNEIPTGKISIAARAALDDLRAALARARGES